MIARVAAMIPVHAVDAPSVLSPAGPRAAREAALATGLLVVGGVVLTIVLALVVVGLVRRRGERMESAAHDHPRELRTIVLLGVVAPSAILVAVYVWSTLSTVDLAAPRDGPVIDVVGHQWWWEVRYPEAGAVTANELHVPVGRPVRVRLTSDDVIHSFWVPRLSGKLDLVPGDTNELWLAADSAGVFVGECAEYCGLQHAHMGFVVVADEPAAYAAWLASEAGPAAAPADAQAREGARTFDRAGCAACHAVRGGGAGGQLGPDLTHVARRRTIGAGTLPNARGPLAAWIADAQHVKPGNRMPRMQLTGAELQAVVHYLEGLR